jgi:hypothetical protein
VIVPSHDEEVYARLPHAPSEVEEAAPTSVDMRAARALA